MNLDFNDICRLCLRFSDKYVDLNQTNGVKSLSKELAEKITFCYLLQIDLSDGLPTKVCYECIQVVSFFYIAKKNVVISEKLLKDVIYVRQKLKDKSEIHKENNKSGSEINKAGSENQNPSRLLAFNYQPYNINDIGINYINECESNNVPNMGSKRDKSVAKVVKTNLKQNNVLNLKKKKDKLKYLQAQTLKLQNQNISLRKPLNVSNSRTPTLKFKMLKKLPRQPQEKLNTSKVNATEKETPKTDTPVEENVFKEIGTVIDTSNILSPSVKRKRKSVLAI